MVLKPSKTIWGEKVPYSSPQNCDYDNGNLITNKQEVKIALKKLYKAAKY